MALIQSQEIPLGSKLMEFKLKDCDEVVHKSSDLVGKGGLIIAVMCNHCPYSNAIWKRLNIVADFAKKLDVATIAINPNIHPNYPEDSPAHMRDKIVEFDIKFPYLVDEGQEISKALGAVCTPDIFLFDKDQKLFYHGRLDDSWHDANSVQNEDLREALIALFGEQEPPKQQFPSQGCSIKWIDTVIG